MHPHDPLEGSGRPFKTRWVRDAVFYFESEKTLEKLVLQRRRWLNGTMAGYVFIALRLPTIVLASSHTWLMKLFTSIMIYMQLLQVFVLALGPGIFASILFGTTQFIATHFLEPDLEELQDHRIESMI